MTILLEGLNGVRDYLAGAMDKGQFGTAETIPAESQTGLISPLATTLLDLDSVTSSDKSIKVNYILPSTGGTTATLTEFEVQDNANSINFDRIVITGISFTSGGTKDINVSKQYFIRQA